MPERRSGHEYQLAFDFTQKPESPAPDQIIRAGTFASFDAREPQLGRFIRSVEYDAAVQSPAVAARFLMQEIFTPFEEFTQEELVALMLNRKNIITHTALIYRGNIDGIFVRNAEVYRPAVLANARSIMIAHNHPSGDPSPSPHDVRFTESCLEAGRILDIQLLDHLIIGDGRWVSLRERKLGFKE